jgi:hypothetical protein
MRDNYKLFPKFTKHGWYVPWEIAGLIYYLLLHNYIDI